MPEGRCGTEDLEPRPQRRSFAEGKALGEAEGRQKAASRDCQSPSASRGLEA
ncbi:unnamed protein product [Symbiodinium natans]|uniref:Uncharacterized protein n=1 Tax=Symbiodinium natans TaxID=878477 RepID=A0A812H6P7_9DINO|nr:unnamed protein product [Symbiodinium natans]